MSDANLSGKVVCKHLIGLCLETEYGAFDLVHEKAVEDLCIFAEDYVYFKYCPKCGEQINMVNVNESHLGGV